MQIILSKSAFLLEKKDFNECGYDYDLVIIQSRLRKLECPHCHRKLACSGYYLRTIITAIGKKIIRIPRLQQSRVCLQDHPSPQNTTDYQANPLLYP